MRSRKIDLRTHWDNAGRIDSFVAAIVVRLDVIHVDRLGDARLLVEVAEIGGKVGVVGDAIQVALEVAYVDGIKAHYRREQAPVGLRDGVARQVPLS